MIKIKSGDVIYVERDCGIFGYKHFGIYSGNRKVIHYTKEGVDLFDGVIRETSLAQFLDGEEDFYVCLFDDRNSYSDFEAALLPIGTLVGKSPHASLFDVLRGVKGLYDLVFGEEAKIYSAEETVERARSRIGERGYDLLFHNCEHFAVWCKTGVEKSEQVEEIIKLVTEGGIKIS